MLQLSRQSIADFHCETSCGTLLINSRRQVLLGHVTGTNHWDIPKGRQEPFESPLDAALRELWEETGLTLDHIQLEEIGDFDYRPDKRLHLYKAYVGNVLDSLDHLVCHSHFPNENGTDGVPAMDGYCWASREELHLLCHARLAQRLLSLHW